MTYNLGQFIKTTYLAIFKSHGTHARLTRKRIIFLLLFYLLWPANAVLTQFCFLFDDIFFPANKKQKLENPLFILGNFRSGTSFLHRLLAKDHKNFTCLNTWEIFLAPSITQRKFFHYLDMCDAIFGNPLKKVFIRFDRDTLGTVNIHKVGFFVPEEDENLMLHIWSSFFVQFMFPFWEKLPRYEFFDSAIDVKTRKKVMQFYKRCIQRHLYTHNGNISLLSKNPSFSPKIESLLETIPEARIVYLVREPHEMLPSTISWLNYAWHRFGDPLTDYPYTAETIEFTKYWYEHPLQVLKHMDPAQYLVIKYTDLIYNTKTTIQDIYQHFGYQLNGDFYEYLSETSRNEKTYKSDHKYSLQKMGLSSEAIYQSYQDIYSEFDFELPTNN